MGIIFERENDAPFIKAKKKCRISPLEEGAIEESQD